MSTAAEQQSLAPQEGVQAYWQLHGLEVYIQDAAQLLLGSTPSCSRGTSGSSSSSATFMAEYLSSVVSGQHVLWRHYAYVAGTHHNRKVFLACARRMLAPTAAAGRLSMGDVHSLLLLLCPDFPLGGVKNCWSAAVALQAWADAAKQQQPPLQQQDCEELVQLQVFLQCFEVTFFFEQYLMALRVQAFNRDKQCMGLVQLDAVIAAAEQQLSLKGWPVPAGRLVRRCIATASRAATYPDFAFVELIKALCSNQELVLHVRQELAATAASAAAAAAANSAGLRPDTSRSRSSSGCGSSDSSQDGDQISAAARQQQQQQQQWPGTASTRDPAAAAAASSGAARSGMQSAGSAGRPWK
uniref:Centriolar satellite-associated tubulin polyglutamylase complex regulator 1 n=1 Tax=Tetradesmus obliquus TaxID=3088 RepID=A0A383V4D7_TETOB|eukprot:jgi/Sobl393_1/9472/SZX59652.1